MEYRKLIAELSGFITERRMELFKRVLDNRTRYLTVVLEDIYQPHNASAVLRSCECFGIQDVHIIENRNEYRINPDVVMGASKWLTIQRYNTEEFNSPPVITALKQKGYRIVATTGRDGAGSLHEFNLSAGPSALFFGTELTGLSDHVMDSADEWLRIPMLGFTESFNISVSAAIILHHLTLKLHDSSINWRLPVAEKDQLMVEWLYKSVRHLRGKSANDEFINQT